MISKQIYNNYILKLESKKKDIYFYLQKAKS